MNIVVRISTEPKDGMEIVFRAPADASEVTGLKINYPGEKTSDIIEKEFIFTDAHGNDIGNIDHVFAKNAVVKVILDVTNSRAFVQNADTNGYIERSFAKSIVSGASGNVIKINDAADFALEGLTLYGKTIQNGTPTPDNPVELVTPGDNDDGSVHVMAVGENFVDLQNTIKSINVMSNAVTVEETSTAVTMSGSTASTWSAKRYFWFLPAGTYTFSAKMTTDNGVLNLSLYSSTQLNGSYSYIKHLTTSGSVSFTLSESCYVELRPHFTTDAGTNGVTWTTKYYDIRIEFSKNLLDVTRTTNHYYTVDGVLTENSGMTLFDCWIPVKKGEALCLSAKYIGAENEYLRWAFFDKEKNFIARYNSEIKLEKCVVQPTQDGYIRVFLAHSNYDISTAQLTYGGAEVEFETSSVGHLHISTPNGLPGIPVTSDGNYTDANGQQWICDEIDFERGVYVQRVVKIQPTSFSLSSITQAPYRMIAYYSAQLKDNVGLCNITNHSKSLWGTSTGLATNINGKYGAVYINLPDKFTTADEINAYIAHTPIVVVAALVTPVETALSAEEIEQYSALHTYKFNTVIINDAGLDMEVKYVTDIKTYIHKNSTGKKTEGCGEVFNDYENNTAPGKFASARNRNTQAIGDFSDVSGYGSSTSEEGAVGHVEGYDCHVNAPAGHAEGYDSIVDAPYGHAQNHHTRVKAQGASAGGRGTIASGEYQNVRGMYNVEDAEGKFAEIVGGGEADSARANIHTLDWEGNADFAGEVRSGGKVLATKESVDELKIGTIVVTTPEAYGAVGNGEINDTEAIQNAINNAKNLIFKGEYLITETITIPSNRTIEFAEGAKIVLNKNANFLIMKAEGSENIKITNVSFEISGEDTPKNSIWLHFKNCTNIELVNCEAVGNDMGGYDSNGRGAVHFDNCDYCRITDCKISGAPGEALVLHGCHNCTVKGGSYSNNKHGSGVATAKNGNHNTIDSVICDSNDGSNISVNEEHDLVINCISSNCNGKTANAITLGHRRADDTCASANFTRVANCIVENNTNGIAILAETKHAIVEYCTVVGNDKNERNNGISSSDGSSNNIIRNNDVSDCLFGIHLNTEDSAIGNNVHDNISYGIFASKISSNGIIMNNIVNGGSYGIYLDNGKIKKIDEEGKEYQEDAWAEDFFVNGNRCYEQKVGIRSSNRNNVIIDNYCYYGTQAAVETGSRDTVRDNIAITTLTTKTSLDKHMATGWVDYIGDRPENNLTENSLFSNMDITNVYIKVNSFGSDYCTHTGYIQQDGYKGCVIQRCYSNGKWSQWEWINPLHEKGVEYLTTERYNGKPVYVKLVNSGSLPNNTYKQIELGIGKATVVSVQGLYHVSNYTFPIPKISDGGYMEVWCRVERQNTDPCIKVYTKIDASTKTADFLIKYTKEE